MKSLYDIFLQYPTIVTDTRSLLPDSIFFALKGPNFNANAFAAKAIEGGCKYAVIDEAEYQKNDQYILVKDVLESLQMLAHHHRKQFSIPIIGLTGTNGKTTTKELMNTILTQKFNVLATKGNFNNHIGVPLTLLSLKKEHEIAIVEMGANKPGDIKELCAVADPDYGLITNIGKAHLEGFGNIETVIKTKTELYDHIRNKNGKIFLNTDNNILVEKAKGISFVSYGIQSGETKGSEIKVSPFLSLKAENKEGKFEINTQLVGTYNAENIIASVCIGNYFGVSNENIKAGLEKYVPSNNRSQIIRKENGIVLMDAYNANPSSMQAAIENFSAIEHPNKFFILGDMFELGESCDEEHKKVIDLVQKNNLKGIFAGDFFSRFKNEENIFLTTTEEVIKYMNDHPIKNYLVLIKGSRGMKLESCLNLFQ